MKPETNKELSERILVELKKMLVETDMVLGYYEEEGKMIGIMIGPADLNLAEIGTDPAKVIAANCASAKFEDINRHAYIKRKGR